MRLKPRSQNCGHAAATSLDTEAVPGALEAEESELRARLNMVYPRIGMIPVEPSMIEGTVGRWTVSDAKLRPPSDYDRVTRIANEALENLKESLKP